MSDKKITQLTALTGANAVAGDQLAIVDVSDTTMSASGTTKKIALSELQAAPLSGGTANGVAFLNGSKSLTTGSALTFDGTNLGVGTTSPESTGRLTLDRASFNQLFMKVNGTEELRFYADASVSSIACATNPLLFEIGGSEQMRLTSTGLGIGTSSPGEKLNVLGGGATSSTVNFTGGATGNDNATIASDYSLSFQVDANNSIGGREFNWRVGGKGYSDGTSLMVLNSSGNLGLGVTPSAWVAGYKALQVNNSSWYTDNNGNIQFAANTFQGSGFVDRYMVNGFAAKYEQISSVHKWFTAPSGTAGDAISFSQVMTLDASGNLGVGTTSFSSKLQVLGPVGSLNDGAGTMRLETFAAGTDVLNALGAGITFAQRWLDAASSVRVAGIYGVKGNSTGSFGGALAFYTQPNSGADMAERARIDSSGNLLVGTTTSTGRVAVQVAANGDPGVYFRNQSGTNVGQIQVSSASTVYVTSSDYRLKENVTSMTGALSAVAALKPCTYTWKESGEASQGFIAHELAEVCPDAVVGEKDAVDEEGNIKPQGIDTSFLVATLTAAIQEQQALITTLTDRITALEAK